MEPNEIGASKNVAKEQGDTLNRTELAFSKAPPCQACTVSARIDFHNLFELLACIATVTNLPMNQTECTMISRALGQAFDSRNELCQCRRFQAFLKNAVRKIQVERLKLFR